MPQNTSPFVAQNPAGATVPLRTSPGGGLMVAGLSAASSALNLTAATLLKAGGGHIVRVIVTVAGTAPGTVNDAATTGAAAAGNLIASIPNVVGATTLEFPYLTGLVIVPGTGQTVSIAYN